MLEINAGMVENTNCCRDVSFDVYSTGISKKLIEYLECRFPRYNTFHVKVDDTEQLSVNKNSFDIVCNKGSISYEDNLKLMDDVRRISVSGRSYISAVSFNNNHPIYELCCHVQYILGNRLKIILKRKYFLNFKSLHDFKVSNLKVLCICSVKWTFRVKKFFLQMIEFYVFRGPSIYGIK